jgi:hypothetical protein
VAREDVDAQFLFQLDDGLGDAGLRGVQGLGGLGEVEVAARRLLDESELVQVHGDDSGVLCAIMLHLYKEAICYFSFPGWQAAPEPVAPAPPARP